MAAAAPTLKARALRLLARRDYTRHELAQRLAPHAADAAELAAAAAVAGTGGLRLPLEAVRWTDTVLVLGAAVAWTLARFAAAWVIVKLAGFVAAE